LQSNDIIWGLFLYLELVMRQITLEKFEGPLDLLLQLIEKNKLNITEISLTKVTDQYLVYIEENKNIASEEVADFLVIAAKLIYLKSRYLLPDLSVSEEDDGLSLARQLKIYRQYYLASKDINKLWLDRKLKSYSRSGDYRNFIEVGFVPPQKIKPQDLRDWWLEILQRLDQIVNLPKVVMAKAVSIAEKIRHIKDLIANAAELKFSQLIDAKNSKTDVVVSFLAILELVKQRDIVVQQDNIFSDFNIYKNNH